MNLQEADLAAASERVNAQGNDGPIPGMWGGVQDFAELFHGDAVAVLVAGQPGVAPGGGRVEVPAHQGVEAAPLEELAKDGQVQILGSRGPVAFREQPVDVAGFDGRNKNVTPHPQGNAQYLCMVLDCGVSKPFRFQVSSVFFNGCTGFYCLHDCLRRVVDCDRMQHTTTDVATYPNGRVERVGFKSPPGH